MSLLLRRPPSDTVIQGEHRIARRQDIMLSTLLGSCVAACVWDEAAQVGGMNHFLLPAVRDSADEAQNLIRGLHAMELLINGLLKAGASRAGLQAKLFGGACIRLGMTDIGDQNAAFAEHFLEAEGIPLVGGSLRGDRGRRIEFWPMSGRARQIYLRSEPPAAEVKPRELDLGSAGELELF